jgi:hypothetical protein
MRSNHPASMYIFSVVRFGKDLVYGAVIFMRRSKSLSRNIVFADAGSPLSNGKNEKMKST